MILKLPAKQWQDEYPFGLVCPVHHRVGGLPSGPWNQDGLGISLVELSLLRLKDFRGDNRSLEWQLSFCDTELDCQTTTLETMKAIGDVFKKIPFTSTQYTVILNGYITIVRQRRLMKTFLFTTSLVGRLIAITTSLRGPNTVGHNSIRIHWWPHRLLCR